MSPRPAPWAIFDFLKLLAIGFLLLPAAQHMEQEDYLFIRVLATFVAVYGCYRAGKRKRWIWAGLFVVPVILFNPLLQFHLGRDLWVIVDLSTAALLAASLTQSL
jgi:small basic protein